MMKYVGPRLLSVLLVWLIGWTGALPQSTQDLVTVHVEGDNAAVVAFLPPAMQASQDKRAAEAQERVRVAIEEVKLCLGGHDVYYRVVFADRIVVRSLGREESFEVRDFAPLVGALLVRPGANARILFAGGGPEALAQMLGSAASEYFGKRCKAG